MNCGKGAVEQWRASLHMPERPEPEGQVWSSPAKLQKGNPPEAPSKATCSRDTHTKPCHETGKTLMNLTGKCKRHQAKHLEKTLENHWRDLPCSSTATIPSGGITRFLSNTSASPKAHGKIQPLYLKARRPETSPFSYSFNKHWVSSQTDILKYHWHLTQQPQKSRQCFFML